MRGIVGFIVDDRGLQTKKKILSSIFILLIFFLFCAFVSYPYPSVTAEGITQEKTELMRETDKISAVILDLDKEIGILKENGLTMREKIPAPEEDDPELNEKVFELKKGVSALIDEVSGLQMRILTLKTSLNGLKRQLPTKSEEIFLKESGMEERISWLERWLLGVEKEVSNLKEEVFRLNERASETIGKIDLMFDEDDIEEVSVEVKALKEEVSLLDKEIGRVDKDIKKTAKSEEKRWKEMFKER
jgi:chromosome segregation ATPase